MNHHSRVVKSLLVVHQGALGDFIVTFPVLKALRGSFDRIDGICRASFGRLAVDIGILDRCHPLESRMFSSLFSERFDPGVNRLITAYGHVLLMTFSSALEDAVNTIKKNRVFRIEPWPGNDENIQVVEFLAERLRACGMLSHREGEAFSRSLHAAAGGHVKEHSAGSTIVLSPGAGSLRKRWPLKRFVEVAAMLALQGYRPVMLLGPAEADIRVGLQQGPDSPFAVVKSESLQDLVGLLDSAEGYIGNDSGVSHLAAFLGIPVLVVFGPSDPVRWRPFGRRVSIVTSTAVKCRPCPDSANTDCREPLCLKQISSQQVLDDFCRIMQTEYK
jgi:hypothetical protein